MFVPTIKYKRVNESQDAVVNSVAQLQISNDFKSKPQLDPRSSSHREKSNDNDTSSSSTTLSSSTATKEESPVIKKEEQQENPSSKETKDEQDNKASNIKEEISTTTTTTTATTTEKSKEPIIAIVNEEKNTQDEPTIEVDPSDKDRILITLTNGKKYTADRYCPHAGADLTYLGEVEEDEYPPEIGPVLTCMLHYWFFLLDKEGRSDNGYATINTCPVPADQCPVGENNKKLDW
ncbi:hypothetical protein BDA99DRAFT_557887 [Phascolomyces articulosus]|uniref:Rieske domain-containing protein n=1 Tax=Phascolomyces articulosus TaxID=60185 RepID=A0AAD5K4S0_9FUNG|nr:hypothetical protein BDA99DRAFT_557887 [Phascolomyces articulosus]